MPGLAAAFPRNSHRSSYPTTVSATGRRSTPGGNNGPGGSSAEASANNCWQPDSALLPCPDLSSYECSGEIQGGLTLALVIFAGCDHDDQAVADPVGIAI